MWEKVNLNQRVKIKLTELGINILKERNIQLKEVIKRHGGNSENLHFSLNLDEEGYYTIQLWDLINAFGGKFESGGSSPFYFDILIEKYKPTEKLFQTWEMIKELTENPRKEFISKNPFLGNVIAKGVNNKYGFSLILFDTFYNKLEFVDKLMLNREWIEYKGD